jgi:uncharacterized membrane protein
MSSPAQAAAPQPSFISNRWPKVLALTIVLFFALAFIAKYVFYYYLHYSEAGFTAVEPHFWQERGWVLLHITSGMTALLIGPWQFSRRFRQRYLQFHRVSGRVYLIAIVLGATASFRLASATPGSRAWSFGLMMLGVAWLITSGMAFYAIRRRHILIHKQWMVRSYVVTFAFVTFRLFNDYPPMSTWLPDADRANVTIWACWAIPLLITEVVLQLISMPPRNTRS